MTAYLDGVPIFGLAVSVKMQPNINAAQISAFFGLTGNQSLFGGGRGRGFMITGLLNGDSPAGCVVAEALLLSYADGLARTLTDPTGVSWGQVVFHGEYTRTSNEQYLLAFDGSWLLPYRCVLYGLT